MDAIVRVGQPQQLEKPPTDLRTMVYPSLVIFCQALSVVCWFGAMSTLTSNLALSVPYALGIGIGLSTMLSLLLSHSAMQARAIRILVKSPGGTLVVGLGIVLALFVYMVQPVLVLNGYNKITALSATFLAQIPLAGTSTWLSGKMLSRVFNEAWYQKATATLFREVRIKRQLALFQLIRTSILDTRDIAKGRPIEQQLTDLLAEVDLKIHNTTELIRLVCERGPKYQSPVYHVLFSVVSRHLEEILAPKKIELPAKAGGDDLADLLEALAKGTL